MTTTNKLENIDKARDDVAALIGDLREVLNGAGRVEADALYEAIEAARRINRLMVAMREDADASILVAR